MNYILSAIKVRGIYHIQIKIMFLPPIEPIMQIVPNFLIKVLLIFPTEKGVENFKSLNLLIG